MKIKEIHLKDSERIVRILMIVILLTAGTSKLFSAGGFFDYYSGLFQGNLRIVLPAPLVNSYLLLTSHYAPYSSHMHKPIRRSSELTEYSPSSAGIKLVSH